MNTLATADFLHYLLASPEDLLAEGIEPMPPHIERLLEDYWKRTAPVEAAMVAETESF